MIMVILDNFTTTSEYSLVIIFFSIISLSSADYDLVNGETGKYRWFDTAAQIYRVCCYCPIEAMSSGNKNDVFQRYHNKDGDFCNPTEDEMNKTGKYPFCICEHKMGLKPEFVGCVLPNNSHFSQVEWTCDNVFRSLNVSVYTKCNPRCTKDSMVLVNPGAQSYRCGENKTWDNQPKSVYCQDKIEECVLPNKSHVSHVEWTCDNVFTSLNVSVTSNTTCKPRCTKDSMVLVNPGALSYRCGENKTWNIQPEFVNCQDKTEDVIEHWIYMVIIVIVASSFVIAIILLITCRQRLQHFCLQLKNKFCSSSENSSSIRMEMLPISIDSNVNVQTSDDMICETHLSNTISDSCSIRINTINYENQGGVSVTNIDGDEERKSIPDSLIDDQMNHWMARLEEDVVKEAQLSLTSTQLPLTSYYHDTKPTLPLLVKVSGIRERYRGGEIYYSVIRGSEIVIVSQIVETDSDFIIDREYDEHTLNYYKIRSASKTNEGVYKWQLKGNSKQERQTGSFYITICDKIRPEPAGSSTVSLPFISLDIDSMETFEEKVMNDGGPGSPSLPCLPEINSPFSSIRFNRAASSERYNVISENSFNGAISSEGQDDITEIEIESVMKKCNRCNKHLISALDDFNSSKYLNNMCHMLDPNTKKDSQCWIGFVKFYGIIEGYRIENIKYHTKGNPEDGHMQYILHQYLPPHDFRIGHLVYYFSQKDSRREDVLLEIKKFHKNCTFCNIYID
ncbi:uncharacterized protein LOC127716573 [Mytilus californianus]|uniref:uncharacterized protein LOC127716573 n=1 Tax=Mytilus californianus TaxID=6549 RepID=UPI0022452412|nr:uncharacterized protein LOC127716573 [Mytilus californianus]